MGLCSATVLQGEIARDTETCFQEKTNIPRRRWMYCDWCLTWCEV